MLVLDKGEKGMLKTLTNEEIYFINEQLNKVFNESQQYLPAKVNFYIQKNKKKIAELALEVEAARTQIIQNFGELKDDGKCYIPQDKIQIAQQELIDLLSIKQEIEINIISLVDIENLHFTLPQMEALMFMIEE